MISVRTKTAVTYLGGVVALLIVTSCGAGASGTAMPYRYLGAVTEEHIWGNSVVADPVPPGTANKISPERLLAMCHEEATCGQGSAAATISLALITTPSSGTARADGTLAPDMNKAIGYVLVWDNQTCMTPRQLSTAVTTQETQTATTNCTRVTVLDEATGKFVLSVLV